MKGLELYQKLSYASCRFGTTPMINLVDLVVFWIYHIHFGLDPLLTGLATGIGKVTMAVSAYIFGYISDTHKSRFGRRKQFLIFGSPMLAISFFFLFSPLLFITEGIFAWLLVWSFAFHFSYGFLTSPYQAWMPELAKDHGDRIDIAAYQNVFNITATAITVSLVLFLVSRFSVEGVTGSGGQVLQIVVIIIAGIEILIFIPTILFIKEEDATKRRGMFSELRIVWQNRSYMLWIVSQGFVSVGMAVLNSLVIIFISEHLGLKELDDLIIFGAVLFTSVALMIRFWRDFAKRNGNRKSIMLGLLLLVISLPMTMIIRDLEFIPVIIRAIIFGVIVGIGLANYYLFQYALLADLAEDDFKNTSEQRAGIYTGINMVSINAFQGLGLFLAGFIALQIEFMGPVISLFCLISVLVIYKTPSLDFNHDLDITMI